MEENKISVFEEKEQEVKGKKKTAKIAIKVILITAPICLIALLFLSIFGFFPDKEEAKEYAQSTIENHVGIKNGSSVVEFDVSSCECKSFRDKSEDDFGFFEYCSNNSIRSDGKEYKNQIVFFQEKYNIDIYDVKKYAYIVKGTCTLKDRGGNTSEKDFELIVVQITGIKFWMYVNEDTMFEPGRDIKTIAENDVRVYAALMYEDVKDCRVKITNTVKDDSETIVYGKVYITNHYGDKYNSTFKVTYDYDYDSLTYEKTDICIDMPVKER